MKEELSRTAMLLGSDAMTRLSDAKVLLFGVGGVGGFAAEALARCGVGHITLVDHDTVSVSNINRQIIALHSTVGQRKVDVMQRRIADINPDCDVTVRPVFYLPESAPDFDFSSFDYVIDAIDTVSAKLDIITRCTAHGTPIISSMGTGNKLDPTRLEIADIYQTSVCPLARVMRRELKARGVSRLDVLYSKEEPIRPSRDGNAPSDDLRRAVPGSVSFVPSAAGLIIAGFVIGKLAGV